MSDLLVIAITGRARAGKDTIANHLVAAHGFTRIAMADGIRSAFDDLDGPTWELRKKIEAQGKTSRWAAQILGTESRQAVGGNCARDHWIDHLLIKVDFLWRRLDQPQTRFVVPDMRFLREHDVLDMMVTTWGGRYISWRVSRTDSGLSGAEAAHASECEIDKIVVDHEFKNDGKKCDLLDTIDWGMDRE